MNMQHDKNALMSGAWSVAGVALALGLVLIFVPVSFLMRVIFTVMGILTVITALPGLLYEIATFTQKGSVVRMIFSAIPMVAGLLMIFWHNELLMIILGVYMILLPILDIVVAADRSRALRSYLPRLLLGVALVILGPAGALEILFDVAGGCIILAGVVYVIASFVTLRRRQNTPGSRIFVDTDGNGTIDAVYVDTTGDGKADTATHYKE